MDVKIAALNFNLVFCKKINSSPINISEVPKKCSANVYKSDDEGSYIVNVFTHIPNKLETLSGSEQSGFLLIEKKENKKLYFQYNGIRLVSSSISTPDEGILQCRDFHIIFKNNEKNPTEFDLYHTQIEYEIDSEHSFSAEAVYVTLSNEDPKTKRGTITTSSQ